MSLKIKQNHSGIGDNIVKNTNIPNKNFFSMENPIIWLIFSIIVLAVGYLFFSK